MQDHKTTAIPERPTPDAIVAEAVEKGVPADWVLEHLRSYGYAVVDAIGTGDDTPLEQALRQFLLNTRPPSGAFGQSMENTMAVHAVVELRAAAAKHLKGLENGRREVHTRTHQGEHEGCPYLAVLLQGEDGPAYICNKCGSGWPAQNGRSEP